MGESYSFKIVQMHLTDKCNLRCSYCYEGRAERSSKAMTARTACEIVSRHLLEEGSHERVEFDFIGGEPLFVWDVIQSAVDYAHSRTWPRKFSFSFTTNGTLFNDTIKSYLDRRSCVGFSFSIDGTREAHNLNRCGSYDLVLPHVPWALERAARYGMEKRVKMTIGPSTVGMISQGIAELHAMGFEKIDANVPYENIWGDQLETSLASFAVELEKLVDYYLARPELDPSRLINLPFEKMTEPSDSLEFPRWCGSGNPMICYDVEARPLPCHRFVEVSTGHQYNGPLSFPTRIWGEMRQIDTSPCVECPFVAACPSCMALNWLENGDVDKRTHWHCGFILLQIKASAKFKIISYTRQIAASPQSAEGLELVGDLQPRLDQALAVHDLFSEAEP